MQPLVHVIIVTHNSQEEIVLCLNAIEAQEHAVDTVTIVDSGSDDASYLDSFTESAISVTKTSNIGFAKANNIGFQSLALQNDDIVIFLNPDAFLFPDAVSQLLKIHETHPDAGCLTGKLLGYDLAMQAETGLLDSTGVFRKWYGRWYDRGHGERDQGVYESEEVVPAICGALMCCKVKALKEYEGQVFDGDFFMYKEDIELSFRFRKNGWSLIYSPAIVAYHCRGWNDDRKSMAYIKRLCSAENEVKLYLKHPSPYIVWAISKYVAVRFFHL